ncbi:MAG: serine/threonine-protein kinase [Candidatus Xenobia bacterium]
MTIQPAGQLWLRGSGAANMGVQHAATTRPVTYAEVELKEGEGVQWDLHAEAPDGFFRTYTGEKTDVVNGESVTLSLASVPNWFHIGLAIAGFLLAVVATLLLFLRRKNQHLAAAIEELNTAEARAGLFPADGSLPSHVGSYRVLDRLGSGGMAVVYKVESTAGDVMAMKLPLPNVIDDPEFKERFERELRIARMLHHPNLVRVMDVSGPGEYPFMVMEWVHGRPLSSYISPSRPLDVTNTLSVGLQVLAALEHAHSQGVVHRDIKPGNIMITTGGQVKVMDFGVAAVKEATRRLTGTEEMLGTPLYMAPEQIESAPTDLRTDIYAVGIVLYEMLAGLPPFFDENYVKVTVNKLKTEPKPLLEVRPELDPALCGHVMRMIQKSPQQRFPTTREAYEALYSCLPA